MRKTMKLKNKLTLIAGLVASSFALNANAGIVTNATDILTGTGHAQLSEWLGEDVNLTRIFAKGVDGNDSYAWHTAVDGQGATFTIMEIFDNDTNERRVIGGYNAVSWHSNNGYSAGESNFLFNLTNSTVFESTNKSSIYGANNKGMFGFSMGGGSDLHVNTNLTQGKANIGFSYGDTSQLNDPVYIKSFAGSVSNWTIGSYETFTLSDSTGGFGMGATASLTESGEPNSVPVTFAFAGLSLLGLGFARRKVES
jgi:hypothetical protein